MAIFVYLTERCREDALNHNILAEVENLVTRVEQSQSTSLFDPFPPPYLVKKQLGGRQGRLVAATEPVDDHTVVVLLAYMIRGNRAYTAFHSDPEAFGEQQFKAVLNALDLKAWVDRRTQTSPPPQFESPSSTEYSWLYSAFAHQGEVENADEMVYETQRWVSDVSQARVSNQLALVCRAVSMVFGLPQGLQRVDVPNKPGWSVHAYRGAGFVQLLGVCTGHADDISAEDVQRHASRLENESELLQRSSRRAYPGLVMTDDDLWIELQKETEANMALSPEESGVLASARGADRPFPLFINGRAGSGKSTVLQYLFADLLYRYVSSGEDVAGGCPIYLTANGELLEGARRFVRRLLLTHPAFRLNGDEASESIEAALADSFQEFRPFLLRQVPVADRHRFADTGRVDYPRFRKLWADKFGRVPDLRDCGPDVSWHVIRTYIKGLSSDGLLDPEDYGQLPKNQRSVTHDAFATVFERVWTWYQQLCESQGFWDDQDLVRYILEEGRVDAIYPAVFCDESQDFTRLELEFLMRLSLFSKRQLAPEDVHRIPFAFAGDQFQTLNPTGFRWEAMKASFVEKFILEMDSTSRRRGNVDLNYRELKFNYRSSASIVRLGNLVQAMRAILLGAEDLAPQVPWSDDSRFLPVEFFSGDDVEFWRHVSQRSSFVILVPCNEGEEAEFVLNDPILKEHIRFEDGVPMNVVSAARAKGCEYPAVVVYGFGQASQWNVVEAVEEGGLQHESPDSALPLKYFINKLYVAVSRPKRRLVIVDSEEGRERLWRIALDDTGSRPWVDHLGDDANTWRPLVQGIQQGIVQRLLSDDAGDPLEVAALFAANGKSRRDAFQMIQAAQVYQGAGKQREALEARGFAYQFDGNYLEAGKCFRDAGLKQSAVKCLWEAGPAGWTNLAQFGVADADAGREIEFRWADALGGQPTVDMVIDLLSTLKQRLSDPGFFQACAGSTAWPKALEVIAARVIARQTVPLDMTEAMRLCIEYDQLREAGMKTSAAAIAECYFAARRYRDALSIWDAALGQKSSNYDKAAAAVRPYPDRIRYQYKLGQFDEIAAAYIEHPDTDLEEQDRRWVLDALAKTGRFRQAEVLAADGAPASSFGMLIDAAIAALPDEGGLSLLRDIPIHLLVTRQWANVGAFLNGGVIQVPGVTRAAELKRVLSQEAQALRVSFVRHVAEKGVPADTSGKLLQKVSEFILRHAKPGLGAVVPPLTQRIVGAALERTGRLTDSLEFYEKAQEAARVDAERAFFRQRWVVVKRRQLERERASGNRGRSDQLDRDLTSALVKWEIKAAAEFPEYPSLEVAQSDSHDLLPPLGTSGLESRRPARILGPNDSTSEVPEVLVGHLRVVVSRLQQRMNLTHTATLETAFVKWSAIPVWGGEVAADRTAGGWRCAAWGLTVTVSEGGVVGLAFDVGLRIEVETA